MDIRNTLSSAWASTTGFARNVGNTVSHYASRAVEQGRLGANHIVSLTKDNPRAAVATAVAGLAILGATAYMFSGTTNAGNTDGPIHTP